MYYLTAKGILFLWRRQIFEPKFQYARCMELTKASHFPKDKRNSPGVLCLSGVSNGILKMTLFFLIHDDFFKGKKARKMIGSDRHCLGKKKKTLLFPVIITHMKGLCHYLPNTLRNLVTDCFQHSENYVMVCVLGANWTLRLTPLTLKASLLCPQLERLGL